MAYRAILDAFTAYNDGDMDTWVSWRERDDASGADLAYEVAVGSRLAVESCTYRGFGEWQMDIPLTGHGFDCAVTLTDRLLEPAGIRLEMIYNWVIGEDAASSQGGSNEDFRRVEAFLREFRTWLRAEHPDVFENMGYLPDLAHPDLESLPTALGFIDEFVAASSDYPLDDPVPPGDYGGALVGAQG